MPVMSQSRRVWRRASRNYARIRNATQLITLGRVYHCWTCFVCGCHANTISWGGSLLFFLATTHETLVKLMSVGSSWCWSNTACGMWRLAGLLSISKHSLKKRASVLLSTAIRLFETKRSIRSVETLVHAMRPWASTPLVRRCLQFHLRLICFFLKKLR